MPWLVVALLLRLPAPSAAQQPTAAVGPKVARDANGMVSAGSPYATEAARQILAAGGNAVDAAAAAHFALMVTDPANASLGGRAQILIYLRDGRRIAIDGMTQAPAGTPPLGNKPDGRPETTTDRSGYAITPVPGNLAAEIEMVGRYGRRTLAEVLKPAIALADSGFLVPPNLALAWQASRDALSRDSGAALHFLKPDGSAYRAGDRFRQPRLAALLKQVARFGRRSFYDGPIGETIARDVQAHGGFVRASDLRAFRAQTGVVVDAEYRGFHVVSAGGRAWGNTLAEMLGILGHFAVGTQDATRDEVELLARIIAQAEADRPQELGTLRPKANGLSLGELSSAPFAAQRAELIRAQMKGPGGAPDAATDVRDGPHDTTHLSVMDAEGNAVSLTTSIGPHFGARVASPELGFLYAHSYRMRSDPTPNARDETEMTPTIVLRDGRPVMVLGGAGSERIPTAILQVISNVIDRGWSLERAMQAPRIFCLQTNLRMQPGFPAGMMEAMRARGFSVEVAGDPLRHLGLVHAVQYDPRLKQYVGAADPGWDGTAGGPSRTR